MAYLATRLGLERKSLFGWRLDLCCFTALVANVTRAKKWEELPARRRARFLRLMREWESENEAMSSTVIGEHAEVAEETRAAIVALREIAKKVKR
jgi:hypothetical protein